MRWVLTGNSGNNLSDWFTVINVQAFSTRDFQLTGIESQLVKDCRMDIRDVMAILYRMETDLIGRPIARHPPSGHAPAIQTENPKM